MRCALSLFLLCALLGVASGCGSGPGHSVGEPNPIAVSRLEKDMGPSAESPRDCIELSIAAGDMAEGTTLAAGVTASNSCQVGMAVLTAPLETRVRSSPTAATPFEGGARNVYARVYIAANDAGVGFEPLGDAGATVLGVPGFWVVGAHSKVEISLGGRNEKIASLAPGSYRIWIDTVAAPAGSTSSHSVVDLAQTVQVHNHANAASPPMVLRERVFPVRCRVASFRVLATKAR
jgi:hypothetical protein